MAFTLHGQGAKTADWWMVNDVNEVDFRTATAHMHSRPQRPRSRNTKTHVDIQIRKTSCFIQKDHRLP